MGRCKRRSCMAPALERDGARPETHYDAARRQTWRYGSGLGSLPRLQRLARHHSELALRPAGLHIARSTRVRMFIPQRARV